MNNGLVEQGGDESGAALVGGKEVSMQVLQQVYKEITDRSENLAKEYDLNHKTTFSDIEQLNYRIEQILEQYNVIEKNCFLTFYHIDDSSEKFSSFDRARAHEVASMSPIANIRIDYDFLIVLPVAKKPQQYKVSIDVSSRLALLEKLKSDSDFSIEFYPILLKKQEIFLFNTSIMRLPEIFLIRLINGFTPFQRPLEAFS